MRAPLLLALALGAFGCVPSAAQLPPDDAAAAPPPEAGRVAPPEGDSGCAFLEKVAPIAPGPGVPRVFAPAGVTVKDVRADLKLSADGAISLLFYVELANSGGAAAEALVGYAFRTPGGRNAAPLKDRVTFDGGIAARSCGAASAPQLHAVYADEAAYAAVPIAAGGTASVSGRATFRAPRSDSPATLFGYPDAAALNLKRYPWSYLKDATYAASADRVRPFLGAVDLLPADNLRVIVSAENHGNWLRAMSHEQNVVQLRSPGMFGWNFAAGEVPARVTFEFNPDLDGRDEIALFQKLVDARPTDLRAMIHLSDAMRFGGDRRERAALLEKLLAAWDGNAEAQLLCGASDVRAAAHVALVGSLHAAGDEAAAKAKARDAIAAIGALDAAAEINRAALAWLKKYLEKP